MVAVLLLIAFAAAGGFGAFLVARADRSADEADARDEAGADRVAVRRAVARAVEAKGAADKQLRIRIVDRAVARQRREDMRLLDHLLEQERRAGDRRAAVAFERGLAAGRAATGGATARRAPGPAAPRRRR